MLQVGYTLESGCDKCLSESARKFQALAAVIDDRMPGLPIISVAREVDPIELIPKLMQLGIRELLASPITYQKLGETIAAITRQLAKHRAPVMRGALLHTRIRQACFILRSLVCLDPDYRRQSSSWLKVLKADSKAIFTAASKAQQATDWMIARAGESVRTTEVAA